MKIVLLGPPASGKGTLAQQISKDFALPHVSTGDILRAEIKTGSKCGKIADEIISKGDIVPDKLMLRLLKQRLTQNDCKNGYILDGYPRNLAQAKALDGLINIDFVFYLDTPLDVIKQRVLGRKICSQCGRVHNTNLGSCITCEACGGELITRKDDTLEVLEKRYEVFKKTVLPLKEFYKSKLIDVKSTDLIEQTYAKVKKVLEKKV